ncbi:DUF5808 domain-containing protein [Puerhibacterium puerhi]|uniref:DUF5808 domain-containing protein n=1 Tax=Puerhibacterium puerhi TaxID=2692623 RepID=UPI001356A50B|nr:DUF5808 domain-containing protein [Puerhibacterium puerhi]
MGKAMTKSTKQGGRRKGGLRRVVMLTTAALAATAVVKELRQPKEQRSWHGTVAGFVPYDFRMPSVAKMREHMWAPENPQVLPPRAFGVGWDVNVGRLVALARRKTAS